MRKRFTINDAGCLVDRDGVVLGRVCGITLDVPLESPLYVGPAEGGGGSSSGSEPSSTSTAIAPTQKKDGGAGETEAARVEDVWCHFLRVADPRRKTLTTSSRRVLLKAVRDSEVAVCKQAIDGLVEYAKRRGGEVNLSRVFATRPGGSTLSDQIEWWASQAPGGRSSAFLPSDQAAEIAITKRAVRQYAEFPGNEHARRLLEEAKRKLSTLHNIETSIEQVVTLGGEHSEFIIDFSDER